jgi:chemotaxis protein methyltransferase CheR
MTPTIDTRNGGRRGIALVEGEYLFTAEDFQRIASLLYQQSGISLNEGKAALVYSRLAKRLRALGLESFRDYCELVAGAEGMDERQAMLTALTTNVTRFFREPHHFEHLRTKLLPDLVGRVRRGGRLRLWSAACSTGQEPYCMAMMLMAAMPDAAEHDVKILASDIDPNVLRVAREGLYSNDLVQDIPPEYRKSWRISDELRELIAFRELNLVGEWPMRGQFDAVFCRNVVIYFDEPTQERIWSRFAGQMSVNAALYIGHSERVSGPASTLFVSDGMTAYRKRAGA